jgi:hypothetical protein
MMGSPDDGGKLLRALSDRNFFCRCWFGWFWLEVLTRSHFFLLYFLHDHVVDLERFSFPISRLRKRKRVPESSVKTLRRRGKKVDCLLHNLAKLLPMAQVAFRDAFFECGEHPTSGFDSADGSAGVGRELPIR